MESTRIEIFDSGNGLKLKCRICIIQKGLFSFPGKKRAKEESHRSLLITKEENAAKLQSKAMEGTFSWRQTN